jgi:hypothetical protein
MACEILGFRFAVLGREIPGAVDDGDIRIVQVLLQPGG